MARPRVIDVEEAARLHNHGETIAAIARRYGVCRRSVQRALNPDAHRRHRDAMAKHRERNRRCIDCGKPHGGGTRCRSCYLEHRAKGRVPTVYLRPLIEAERDTDGQWEQLSFRLDVPVGTLQNIVNGRLESVSFVTADRVLTGLGRVDLWHTELADVYEAAA